MAAFDTPFAHNDLTRLAFLLNFSIFDCAENGLPSFLPFALMLARLDFVRSDMSCRSISAAKPKAKAKTLLFTIKAILITDTFG